MILNKEALKLLRVQFTALQNLQKKNKKAVACLPTSSKTFIAQAQKILKSNPPTGEEIKKHIDTTISEIKKRLPTIDDLFQLDDLEISDYGDLKLYYDSYSKYLDDADKTYYGGIINNCKKLIDKYRNELQTNPDDNKNFVAEIEAAIEALDKKVANATTLEDGDTLKSEFDDLSNTFESNTENATSLSTAWTKEMKGKLTHLGSKISQKRVELSEDVADETNTCRTIPLSWVVREQSRNVEKREAKIDRSITKISELLKRKYTFGREERPTRNQERRKKRLIKKLQKLQIKEAIETADETKITDTEPMDFLITFCKKQKVPTGSDKGPTTYWGISEIKVPENRQTENNGGLSYTFSPEITSKGFSDMVVVSIDIVREAAAQVTFNWENLFGAIADFIPTDVTNINWLENVRTLFRTIPNIVEQANIPSQDSRMKWTLSIDTDPNNPSDVNVHVTPEDDFKNLGELEYKRVETFGSHISFEGNLKEANAEFIKQVKSRLSIK